LSAQDLSKSRSESRTRVSFEEHPKIITLAPVDSFDQKQYYTDSESLQEMISRNELEFKAEGRNWNNVVEEENMVRNESGELVHPIHLLSSRSKSSKTQSLSRLQSQPQPQLTRQEKTGLLKSFQLLFRSSKKKKSLN